MRSAILSIVSLLVLVTVGFGMTPEARKSFEAFEQRAEAGDPEALYRLSAILERGFDTIAPDTVRSLSLLRRSAAAGYAPAMNYLGYLFKQGHLIPTDRDSSLYYITKAAQAGDPTAAHNLAFMLFETPVLSDKDSTAVKEALEYLKKSAESGLPQAQTLLGDLYSGSVEGLPPEVLTVDTAKAVSLYEKAILQGFNDAELRLLNLMGPEWQRLDSETALEKSIYYWNLGAPTIAVELLHLIGPSEPQTAQAYAILGHAYSRGQGAPYDHRKANEYFARAALLGNPSAQFILAETLEIFPDVLTDLLHEDAILLDAVTLREEAKKAGILSAEDATHALFEK